MDRKIFIAALLCMCTVVYGASAIASASTFELWNKVHFVTEDGDEVTIALENGAPKSVAVRVAGKKILFSKDMFEDLKTPLLNRIELLSSSGVSNDVAKTTYSLQFPLADPSKESQQEADMSLVDFVMENGVVVERDIWQNSKKLKLVSQIVYKPKLKSTE